MEINEGQLTDLKAGGGQHELERIFEQVYGRKPESQELVEISSMPAAESETGAFRTVVRYFDHQTHPTGFSVRMSPLDVHVIITDGVKLAVDIADRSVSMPIAAGVYEPHMRAFYESHLKPGMTFVDVGANVGMFTALAAKLVGELGRVIAFEPNSENCRLILMSARLNGFNNVKLIPIALHHVVGYALFTSAIGTNGGFLPSVDASLSNPTCTVVPTMKLDDLIDGDVDFIKMDVEGAEGLVIKGAVRTIERCRPVITTEVSAEMLPRVSGVRLGDYLAWFDSMGYESSLIDKATGNLIPITDTGAFAAEWGRLDRIEDLAFFPTGEHENLKGAFKTPPNVFDGFVKSEQLESERRAQEAEAKVKEVEQRASQAEAKAEQAEVKAQQAEQRATQAEATLQAVFNSRSWRVTQPLRRLAVTARLLREKAKQ